VPRHRRTPALASRCAHSRPTRALRSRRAPDTAPGLLRRWLRRRSSWWLMLGTSRGTMARPCRTPASRRREVILNRNCVLRNRGLHLCGGHNEWPATGRQKSPPVASPLDEHQHSAPSDATSAPPGQTERPPQPSHRRAGVSGQRQLSKHGSSSPCSSITWPIMRSKQTPRPHFRFRRRAAGLVARHAGLVANAVSRRRREEPSPRERGPQRQVLSSIGSAETAVVLWRRSATSVPPAPAIPLPRTRSRRSPGAG
jgi:hypothetical protein